MSFLQGDSAEHSAHQQASFIMSPAPAAPDSETDNAPYLSGESRVREAGGDNATSVIRSRKHCKQTAPGHGTCNGNLQSAALGGSVEDTGTHTTDARQSRP